ncbi:MAG: hypothetical protein CFE28_12935 [Alphaproteobacteria bacterium PA2]|nr:MAG: hypothetical protein CFE28_12935 [Alphaproteobacteria bacterium PA2]
MPRTANKWLLAAGILSLLASLMHIAIIIGGPDWYRAFGAGERMARAAARGAIMPTLVTLGIASVLAIWALYAFSGAGLIRRLPLLRTGLVVITAIYLARGLALFPALIFRPDLVDGFIFWSSFVVLGYGATYAIGTFKAWDGMSKANLADDQSA